MGYLGKFPILEYYRRVVMPIDRNKYWIKSDKMAVCPLHDDVNPSMGIMVTKNGDELFHCFGCNRWGDVVKLHKGVSRRLYKRYLSDEESLKDLCKIFGVSYDEVVDNEHEDYDEGISTELALRKAVNKFDISDFRRMIYEGKLHKKSIGYFNTITMMMVHELNSNV